MSDYNIEAVKKAGTDWILSTDTAEDIPADWLKENDIDEHPLHYVFDGVEYGNELENTMTLEQFYERIRNGEMPTTSATAVAYSEELFTKRIGKGQKNILHIAFSSGLSGTYANTVLAAKDVTAEHPEANIVVLDTKSATAGVIVLIYHLLEMKKNGATMEEAVHFAEENIPKIRVHFTVGNLFHLMRGGRLSKTSAVLGTVMRIQPILRVEDAGTLASMDRVRGRRQALKYLCDEIGTSENFENVTCVSITHTCCLEDAEALAKMIREAYPQVREIPINMLSQTVGSHTGIGCLVIGYLAGTR